MAAPTSETITAATALHHYAGLNYSHDVFAELLRAGSGHGAHPSKPPCGQARSDDLTYGSVSS